MVHTFKINNNDYIFDVESSSLFKADELVLLVLKHYFEGVEQPLLSKYSNEDIDSVLQELTKLKEDGCLYAECPKETSIQFDGEVKALCIHICHDCNLTCGYCFADGGTFCGERESMSLETGKKAIDFLISRSGKRKNLEVDFFGGEPLLNLEVIKKIVSYARAKESEHNKLFKFTVTTNAILLDEKNIEYFNAEMDNVVVSVDGRKSVHDNMRKRLNGKGSYDTVIKKALMFKKLRGNKSYFIRGTFTSKNLDFSEDVLSLAKLGFEQLSIEPVVLSENHPLAIKSEHITQINAEYEKLAKHYIEMRKKDETWFNFFHFMIDLENSPCLKKKLTGCGAGSEYLAVTPNGDIYPCHQFAGNEKYRIGSVIDNSPLNEDLRKVFMGSNLLTKPHCADCSAKYFCSGGCAANSIKYGGGIDKPHKESCAMMVKRFETALAVYSEERLQNND